MIDQDPPKVHQEARLMAQNLEQLEQGRIEPQLFSVDHQRVCKFYPLLYAKDPSRRGFAAMLVNYLPVQQRGKHHEFFRILFRHRTFPQFANKVRTQ
jgi:hypothetical protein